MRYLAMLESLYSAIKFIVRHDGVPHDVVFEAAEAAARVITRHQRQRRSHEEPDREEARSDRAAESVPA